MAKEKPLSIQEAMFADLVATGLTLSDAYRRAFPESKAQGMSLNVQASRLRSKSTVSERINALQSPGESVPVLRDPKLLSAEWMTLEIANGLYQEATAASSSRERIDAWRALGQLKAINCFVASGSSGTTVNVQQNALASGNDASVLRGQLVESMRALLPATDVIDTD